MAITGTVTISVAGLGDAITQAVAQSTTASVVIDESIVTATTDKLLTGFVLTRAQVKVLIILADQVMTLDYNDAAGTQGSIALTANTPVLWYTGCGHVLNSLLAADITSLYATNTSGATARLRIAVLADATV